MQRADRALRSPSSIRIRKHPRAVGRGHAVFFPVVLAIHRYLTHAGHDSGAAEQHVDAERDAAAEGTTPAVPPGELLFIRVQVAGEAGEPRIEKRPMAVRPFAGAEDRALQV